MTAQRDRQEPIGSGFDAASTAEEVMRGIDLRGKKAIVTGGYSGLGREVVRVLVNAGARVVVPARDVARASDALRGIDASVEPMDLLDRRSIDAFAEHHRNTPLHLLVLSAAIMACPLARDARGFESQFATNHLGHFQLTKRLLPELRREGARVVSVSSMGPSLFPRGLRRSEFRAARLRSMGGLWSIEDREYPFCRGPRRA